MANETTIKTGDAVKTAINAGAWGSDYAATRCEEREDIVRVHVTHRGRGVGHVAVVGDAWDLSTVRLHSSAHGKADGWLRSEMARIAELTA